MVESVNIRSFMQNLVRMLVLNHKGVRIKCNRTIIILGELMNRQEVRRNVRYMKKIIERKRILRSRE